MLQCLCNDTIMLLTAFILGDQFSRVHINYAISIADLSTLRYRVVRRSHDIKHKCIYACISHWYRPNNRPTGCAFDNNAEVIIISGTAI